MSTNLLFKGQKFIGVVKPSIFRNLGDAKRLMLMFDGLALDLSYNLHAFENRIIQDARAEIDFLSDQGLLTTLSGLEAQYGKPAPPPTSVEGSFWIGERLTGEIDTWNRAVGGVGHSSRLETTNLNTGVLRYTASNLRLQYGIDAVAVPTENEPFDIDSKAERETVIKITVNNFPTPSDATSWENILDFKKDKVAASQHLRLKAWMNDIASKEMKGYEVSDQLAALVATYEQEMKIREIATKRSTFQVFLIATGEARQNLARLKFGDTVKALFDISKHKLNLLEEEKKAEGREVAFIYSANKQFR
jgi:hypothetical protein